MKVYTKQTRFIFFYWLLIQLKRSNWRLFLSGSFEQCVSHRKSCHFDMRPLLFQYRNWFFVSWWQTRTKALTSKHGAQMFNTHQNEKKKRNAPEFIGTITWKSTVWSCFSSVLFVEALLKLIRKTGWNSRQTSKNDVFQTKHNTSEIKSTKNE